MVPHMAKVGKEVGINFSYGGDISNTLASHCLVKIAQDQGKEDAVVEELFKNYFEREKAPSDMDMLLDVAKKTGLKDVTAETIGNPNLVQEVKKDMHKVRSAWEVSGVPHFIIDGDIQLSGAQPAEYFLRVFDHVLKRREAIAKAKAEAEAKAKAKPAAASAATEAK
eukprot:INCI7731.1.p1 GENE.INCI7731.1~~INCI7731.1.p1  ORF type:complete len:167 (-),score=46.46 INCI7731.1:1001-1501(-)